MFEDAAGIRPKCRLQAAGTASRPLGEADLARCSMAHDRTKAHGIRCVGLQVGGRRALPLRASVERAFRFLIMLAGDASRSGFQRCAILHKREMSMLAKEPLPCRRARRWHRSLAGGCTAAAFDADARASSSRYLRGPLIAHFTSGAHRSRRHRHLSTALRFSTQ